MAAALGVAMVGIWAFVRFAFRVFFSVFIKFWRGIASLFGLLNLWRHRIARMGVIPGTVVTLFVLTTIYTTAAFSLAYGMPLFSYLWEAQTRTLLVEASERAYGVAIRDQDNEFIGMLDRRPELDIVSARGPIEQFGYEIWPDHKTLYVKDAPQYYWSCLQWLEDRNMGSIWNPGGIDFTGLMRIPVSVAQHSLAEGGLRLRGGGSTLPMQLVRSFQKRYPGQSKTINRKLNELMTAPVLYRLLVDGDDISLLRQWAAMHFAHIQGAIDVFGVEATAQHLFGTPASGMSIAQQFTLAASIKQPIQWGNQAAWRRLTFGNDKRKGRARLCAENLLGVQRAEVVLAELRKMSETLPIPAVSQRQQAWLEEQGLTTTRAFPSPERRLSRLTGHVQRGVIAELRDAFDGKYRGAVQEARLTLDVIDNQSFGQDVSALLRRLPGRLPSGYNRSQFSFVPEKNKEGIHVVLVAARENGEIVRYFTNQFDTHYFGTVGNRNKAEGGVLIGAYDASREKREIASTGKVLAALAIGEAGGEKRGRGYNNQCLNTTKGGRCFCTDNPDCRDSRNYVQVEQVFAGSLNDALIRRLNRKNGILATRANALARQSHLTIFSALEDVSPATRVVLGRYAATPRRVQQLMAAAFDYVKGGSGTAVAPTLIRELHTFNPVTGETATLAGKALVDFSPTAPVKLSLRGSRSGRRFVSRVLSAPLCDNDGTLRALKQWCAGKNGVRHHIAKSGTWGFGPGGQSTVDWWITGAIEFQDRRSYSYVALVGTGNPSKPFARRLSARHAAPLIRLLIEDLSRASPPTNRDQ